MGTRINDEDSEMDKWTELRQEFPAIKIGCLNRAHREVVEFLIPAGKKNARCPKCGRRAGRK